MNVSPTASFTHTAISINSDIKSTYFPESVEQSNIIQLELNRQILPPPEIEFKHKEFGTTIPMVDMADWYSGDSIRKQKFTLELSQAFETVGFIAVKNPGVKQEPLDKGYESIKQFFGLSQQEKDLLSHSNNGQRGYVPSESAKGEAVKDHKEFYHVGRELNAEKRQSLGYSPNIWPTTMDLKTPLVTLFNALEEHMIPIQQALAQAIGQPQNFFTDMTREGDILLRALHYPPIPAIQVEASVNSYPKILAAAHTDIDLFTILPKATEAGLQLYQNGVWIDVKVPEDAFIINAGDMLENITNGRFKSARHRVVSNNENKERFSMVLFVHPRSDDQLGPLDSCIAYTGGVKKYADATRWELLLERLVDLGLVSDKNMIKFLGECGLLDRLIDMQRASEKAVKTVVEAGFASEKVQHYWQNIKEKIER